MKNEFSFKNSNTSLKEISKKLMNKKNNSFTSIKNYKHNNRNRKSFVSNVFKTNSYEQEFINEKREKIKKKKISFSLIDNLLYLKIIEPCRNRTNKYSYYNIFYKGKYYLIDILEIKNYLKYLHYIKLLMLLKGEKENKLSNIITPILSSNYVGINYNIKSE